MLGSFEWWEHVASESEYFQNSRIPRSSRDESLVHIYQSTFATLAWADGVEPWQRDFGEFVRTTPFDELPDLAQRLFIEEMVLQEDSPAWLRPYIYPQNLEEVAFAGYLAGYLGWGACLAEQSWGDCEVAIGGFILEYSGLF